MTERPAPATDDPMADRIATVTGRGVAVASAVFAISLALSLLRLPGAAPCAAAGCVVLIALPAARLLVMASGFARRRDVAFTAITIGVLALTAGSLAVGLIW